MITLYGPFELLESLTIDLHRSLLWLGLVVVWEVDDVWEGERRRRMRVERVRG